MGMIDGLPPLREVIRAHDLAAKRQLGQNFILDLNLTAKIARLAGDLSQCDVLEIGPGPGGLTRGLLVEGARRVLAIEKDPRCIAALEEIAAVYPGRRVRCVLVWTDQARLMELPEDLLDEAVDQALAD